MISIKWLIYFKFISIVSTALERPHIVIILVDDLGYNDVGFLGSDHIQTPNIDALAFNGIIFNHHYTQPVCTPSRAALMTGKYPIRTGMQGDPTEASERKGLPLNEKIMPEYFRNLGYRTHAVGKWHLGYFKESYTPLKRGFDTFLGYYNGWAGYYDHVSYNTVNVIPTNFRLLGDLETAALLYNNVSRQPALRHRLL